MTDTRLIFASSLLVACAGPASNREVHRVPSVTTVAAPERPASPPALAVTPPTPEVEGPPASNAPLTIEVRAERPSKWTVDGNLEEWSLREPSSTSQSRVVVTLLPKSWLLAFDLRGDFHDGIQLDVELPGGEVPAVGEIARGGGAAEDVDCEHDPWSGSPRPPRQRELCRRVVARYEALKKAEALRFRRRLTIDPGAMQSGELGTLERACAEQQERLRCELELPLGLLPRSGERQLSLVGLRALPRERAADGPVALTDGDWYTLPTEVAFEPGAAIRREIFGDNYGILPERDRHSFQPGELAYELIARSGGGLAELKQTQCQPETEVARSGDVMLGLACGVGFVFHRGEFKGLYPSSVGQRIVTRSGELFILAPEAWYEPSLGSPGASWTVTRIDAQGQTHVVTLAARELWDAVRPTHDTSYELLRIEGHVQTEEGKRRALSFSWKWNPAQLAYVPVGNAPPPAGDE
jgi:hypothetical protein